MAKKVLIVDSDPGLTISLKFIMKKEGHDIFTVSTGEEAYNFVITNEPDLIILDVVLSDCTGFEICQRIRERSSLATKIILLTSKGRNKDIEKGKALGVDLYIVKPFSTIEFIGKLRFMLGGVSL